ncbi:MAG: fumarylacetoacetate hydrolase family protein, partial [Sphingobium sp.]|nr:fumarylacetoacetate hydrolase family protein [Sphingobium sp.]
SYISQCTELLPGDVIVTGCGEGVGIMRQPPLMLQDGDVCEIEIEGIGILKNPVADAEGDNRAPLTRANIEEAIQEIRSGMSKAAPTN